MSAPPPGLGSSVELATNELGELGIEVEVSHRPFPPVPHAPTSPPRGDLVLTLHPVLAGVALQRQGVARSDRPRAVP